MSVIVAPLRPPAVQTEGVDVVNVTCRPDDEVADTVTGDWDRALSASAPNVIVWLTLSTVNDCCTDGATLKVALPAWSAWMVHMPAATRVMVVPLVPPVVHTNGVADVNVTVRPDVAVAETVNGDSRASCRRSTRS